MIVNPLTASILKAILVGGAVEFAKCGITYVYKIFTNIDKFSITESLSSLSRPLQVEPLCIIDTNLRTSESLQDIQQTVLNLFASFYIQSVSLSMIGKEVEIHKKIGRYGTNVSDTDIIDESKKIFGKAVLDGTISGFHAGVAKATASTEDYSPLTFRQINASLDKANYNPFTGTQNTVSTESNDYSSIIKEIKDDNRISVGKIIGLTIRDKKVDESGKEHTVEINVPVAIRLINGYLRNDQITDYFALKDLSKVERTIAFKTGKLSFFKDILFCMDIYKQFRRNLVKDKTGVFKSTIDKKSQTSIDQIQQGAKSTTGITNNLIVTSATTKAIEDKLRIKFNNFKQRDTFMTNSGVIIYVDVNENFRMVTIYFHGVERGMELSFNDLKKASSKDPNISDIIQALTMGNAPRLF